MAQRGEIWERHAGDTIPDDLVLVISSNRINNGTDFIICLLITLEHYGLSYHIEVPIGQSGLGKPSYIQCEEIYKSPSGSLARRLGAAPSGVMRQVAKRLENLLDL